MPVYVVADPAGKLFEISSTSENLNHAAREVLEQWLRIGERGG
jgi:hypothetical protein